MKTFPFDAVQIGTEIQPVTTINICALPLKKLKHYYRYYSTTLTFSTFNFDYEPEYLDFIRSRVKILGDEIERRRVKHYRITEAVPLLLQGSDDWRVITAQPYHIIRVGEEVVSVKLNELWCETCNTPAEISKYLKQGKIAEIKMKENEQ